MARGWESKSVEAQQADAILDKPVGPPVSPDDASRRARLATLTLARKHAQADLHRATASAHRSMLERALADLDRQIASLS